MAFVGVPDGMPDGNDPAVAAAPQFASRRESRAAASRAVQVRLADGNLPADAPRPLKRGAAKIGIAGVQPRKARVKRKNPFPAALTMLVTGGMFAVAGLPAYASSLPEADTASTATVSAAVLQTVTVDASTSLGDVTRAGFTATTPEELRQMQAAASAAAASARRATQRVSWATSVVQSEGDDYPWANHPGGSFSPLRYVYRQCVDFVAWRLNRDAGSTHAPFKYDWGYLTPGGGDGRQWLPAWRDHGWPVSNVPVAGAVAYTGGNHVAYVKEVLGNGDVLLEEYNWVPQSYSQRTVPSSSVVAFLYPPPR